MGTPPDSACRPTAAAPGPSWKTHPEFRRLRLRQRLLGAAGLLFVLLFVVASYLQARTNAILRARLNAMEIALRVANTQNDLLRQELKHKNTMPSPPSTEATLSTEPSAGSPRDIPR